MISVKQSETFEETGQWRVTVAHLNNNNNNQMESIFDGVLICTGHHVKPLIPTFKGQDKFKGK